jgi:iron complex transport system permease protein
MTELPGEMSSGLTGRKLAIYALVGLACTVVTALGCSLVGLVHIDITAGQSWQVWNWPLWQHPVWQLRLGRLATAAVSGSALAAAGMALQGLLRNDLAEPYILGISSGAGVGVILGQALVGAMGLAAWATTPVLALAGALATCAVVYGIAQRRGRLDPYVLLLSGVVISVFNSAIIMGVMLFVNRNELLAYIGWGMGRVSDHTNPSLLLLASLCVLAGWGVLLLRGSAFNMLGLGDDVAASSGVSVHYLRVETFAVVGLMTASAVALAGPIGFLGLIVPHIARMIVGADHRRLVLVSGFAGAVVLMLADTLARTAGAWVNIGDIPVGVITALAGGPFFIYLLRRRFRGQAI